MMKINAIVKAIKAYSKVTDYAVKEVCSNTVEQFYDLQKLETTRITKTVESEVKIYTKFEEDGKKYLGNASFIVSHKLSKKELNALIEDAIYQASFVKNEYYELPSGDKKRSFSQKEEEKDAFSILEDISKIFFSQKTDECMFNSLECFFTEEIVHLVNSKGVDYKKKVHKIEVEAIPSFKKGEKRIDACELYRMFNYDKFDEKKVTEDAKGAISDVINRSKAIKRSGALKANVILKKEHLYQMFDEIISAYSYSSVYNHTNYKNKGDKIQENPKCPLNISLIPESKADYFDSDGVLLKETLVIKDGVVNEYYGNNRFAYYLNTKPSGTMYTIKAKEGKLKYENMKKKPYIEIIDLSGLQVDLFGDYIGGEVRLANYFDGKDTYPITAFSFSGSLQEVINNLDLSKEKTKIKDYVGPKYALLKDLDIL